MQSMFLRMSMPEPAELVEFKEKLQKMASDTEAPAAEGASNMDVAATLSQRTPFVRLIKGYWDSLTLHVMFEVWYSMAFYAFTAWMPSFYHSNGVSALTTQGMQIASLFACGISLIIIGYLCDKKLPCMPTYAAAVIVSRP